MRRAGGWDRWIVAGAVALVATVLPLGVAEAAEVKTWTGGGADARWSTAANWSPPGAPANDDSIVLPAGSTSRFDITGLRVASIATTPGGPNVSTEVQGIDVGPIGLTGGVTAQGGFLRLHPGLSFAPGGHDLATAGGILYVDRVLGAGNVRTMGSGHVYFAVTAGFDGAIEVRSQAFGSGGLGSSAGGLTIAAGSFVTIDTGSGPLDDAIRVLDGPSPAHFDSVGVGTQRINGPVRLDGDLQLVGSGTVGGVISGPGRLDLAPSAGPIALEGTNTYAGGTVVSREVRVSGASPFGSGAVDIRPDGTIDLRDGSILENDVTYASTDGRVTGFLRVLGAVTVNGPVTISGTETAFIDFGNGHLALSQGLQSSAPLEVRHTADHAAVPLLTIVGPSSIPSLRTDSVDVIMATGPSRSTGEIHVAGPHRATLLRFLGDNQHNQSAPITVGGGILDLWGSDQQASSVNLTLWSALYLGVVLDDDSHHSSVLRTNQLRVVTRSKVVYTFVVDQSDLIRAGSVELDGALEFYLYGDTPLGHVIELIDNVGTGPVVGRFDGGDEGWYYPVSDGQLFRISYFGGDGNDVTLTKVGHEATSWEFEPLADFGGRSHEPGALSSWGPRRLDAFVTGTDGTLWHTPNNGGWWEWLGGRSASGPAAVSQGFGNVDVFLRGTDNRLWMRSYRGGWQPWQSLGGFITEAPAVTSQAPGSLDVVARGGDGQVWHRAMRNNVWQAWQPLGGFTTHAPAISDGGPGLLDVFVRGGDGQVWQRSFNGAWGAWGPLGGQIVDGPAVAGTEAGEMVLFAPAPDGRLWMRSHEGGGWQAWASTGHEVSERVAAVGQGPNDLAVGFRTPQGSLGVLQADQFIASPRTAAASVPSAATPSGREGASHSGAPFGP